VSVAIPAQTQAAQRASAVAAVPKWVRKKGGSKEPVRADTAGAAATTEANEEGRPLSAGA
jgi:hypothetical protein